MEKCIARNLQNRLRKRLKGKVTVFLAYNTIYVDIDSVGFAFRWTYEYDKRKDELLWKGTAGLEEMVLEAYSRSVLSRFIIY